MEDVIDYWVFNDMVFVFGVLFDFIVESFGGVVGDVFFSEVLELESVLGFIFQYVVDFYVDFMVMDMYDFIVEDEILVGILFDLGNLFDFLFFFFCYDFLVMLVMVGLDGGLIGVVVICDDLINLVDGLGINLVFGFLLSFNLVLISGMIFFIIIEIGMVSLVVYDLIG